MNPSEDDKSTPKMIPVSAEEWEGFWAKKPTAEVQGIFSPPEQKMIIHYWQTVIIHYWQTPLYPRTRCVIMSEEIIPHLEQALAKGGLRVEWQEDAWKDWYGDEERVRCLYREINELLAPDERPDIPYVPSLLEAVVKRLKGQ